MLKILVRMGSSKAGHCFDVLRARVAKIRAFGAVDVDIHKTRGDVFAGNVHCVGAVQRAGGSHLSDLSVRDLHVRQHKARVFGENKAVFQDHIDTLL